MRSWGLAIAVLLAVGIGGCAPVQPRYRTEALTRSSNLRLMGAEQVRSQEFASIIEALETGDRLLQVERGDEADEYFILAIRKAELLEKSMADEKLRQELERIEAEERAKKAESIRAMEEEKRRLQEEREREIRESRRKTEKPPAPREKEREPRQLPQFHTVKRGETLPQIAAQADVYGDPTLWPLLYRANRDQIRDPARIWPGQVLRIPRNMGRDDILEARRYAHERQLR